MIRPATAVTVKLKSIPPRPKGWYAWLVSCAFTFAIAAGELVYQGQAIEADTVPHVCFGRG